MNFIIETDLGADPDDLFVIIFLISKGIKIGAIVITPGYPNQIAIARMICSELNQNIPIGYFQKTQKKLKIEDIIKFLLINMAIHKLQKEILKDLIVFQIHFFKIWKENFK